MNGFSADCRHAFRLYLGSPVASVIAVAVLAVGMAFSGAFLSLYVDLVLRPDPGFQDSRRIATVGQNFGEIMFALPYGIVERMSDEMTSIEAAASVSLITTIVESETEPTVTGLVSSEFFSGLRPRLALGRGFTAENHASLAEPAVVLSYRYWQQQFDGDTNIIGTVLEVSRNPNDPYESSFADAPEQATAQFRIIGVMAETLPSVGRIEPGIWVPLERVWPVFAGTNESLQGSGWGSYVRRAPGVSTTAFANELRARYDSPDVFSDRMPGTRLDAIDGIVTNIIVQRETRRQLEMFLAGSLLLAIVAAANLSLFLLARAPGRRRELGIRMAVGAPLARLSRQLATEAGSLVLLGGLLGLLGSIWLSTTLRNLDMLRDAEWDQVTLFDWRVLSLFGLSLLLLGTLVSLAPIVGLKRLGIAEASRLVSARASLAQRLAGAVQLGIAAAIGAAAIAFGWHLALLVCGDAGYETSDRYLVEGSSNVVPANRIVALPNRRQQILTIPGVRAVAFGYPVPADPSGVIWTPSLIPHPTEPGNSVEAYFGAVNPPFVELLGLRLLHGHVPDEEETAGVVVVNQALARALWGRDDVVGERLPPDNMWGRGGVEVIGVLEDQSFDHPSAAVPPYVFSTLASTIGVESLTVIEAELTASELHQELDRLLAAGALEMTVENVSSLDALRNGLLANDRIRTFLTMVTAAIVVFLAAIGFYGTQRYLVAVGRREYAIRASLGAGPRALGWLVLRRSILLGLPGLAFGAFLAFIVVAWLEDDYVTKEVSPTAISLGVVICLALLIIAASAGPARQTCRIQPAPLLRED